MILFEANSLHRYRFCGFTESQVKAGKLMFFREDEEWSVERLLASFGDLPSVYLKSGYGKYAARLGLSFSSTVESLDVCPASFCPFKSPDCIEIELPDTSTTDASNTRTHGSGWLHAQRWLRDDP